MIFQTRGYWTSLLLLAVVLAPEYVYSAAPPKRPNIIVFLVDDYDKYETSVYGGKVLTPNLDRLARDGMTFHNAHVTTTVCTPSRYTFLTGRYAGSAYGPDYLENFPLGQQALPGFNMSLEKDNMNVGSVLAKHGYATGFVGKYHVGNDGEEYRTANRLHDVPKNTPFSRTVNRQQYENEKRYRELIQQRGFTWAKNIYWQNTKAPFESHNPEWTAEAAVEFITKNRNQPFYLHYCTTLLHGPNRSWSRSLEHPEITGEGKVDPNFTSMPDRASVMKRIQKANLTSQEAGYLWMDDSLGAILKTLDKLGLTHNTLILFIADHGSTNKGSLLKTRGTEVPCIIKWPAGITAGTNCHELIQNTDFVPTWFQLAGATAPSKYQMDGITISPLFESPTAPIRDYVYAEIGAARSVKTKRFNYIALRYTRDQIEAVQQGSRRQIKSITGLTGGVARSILSTPDAFANDQLYDLLKDPSEQNNLARSPEYQDTLKQMQRTLVTELQKFTKRPFGELVPGKNTAAAGSYDGTLKTLRKAALENTKKKPKS